MSNHLRVPMSTAWNGENGRNLLNREEIENEAILSTLECAIKTYGFSLIYNLGQQMGENYIIDVTDNGCLRIHKDKEHYNSDNNVQLVNIIFNKIRRGEFARHQIKDWDGVEDYQTWLDRTMDSFIFTMPFSEILNYGIYNGTERYQLKEIFNFHKSELDESHQGIGDYSIATIKNVFEKYLTPDIILTFLGENVHEDYSDVYDYYTCTKKEDGVEKTLTICPDYHNIHTIYEIDDSNKLSSLGNSYEYLLKTLQIPITTLLDSILYVKNPHMIPKHRPLSLDQRVVDVMKQSDKVEDYVDIRDHFDEDLSVYAYLVNAKSKVNKTIDQHIREGMRLKRTTKEEKLLDDYYSKKRLWIERAIFSQIVQLVDKPKTLSIGPNGLVTYNFSPFQNDNMTRHMNMLFIDWKKNFYDRHQIQDLKPAELASMSEKDRKNACKKVLESYIGTIPFKRIPAYTQGTSFVDAYFTSKNQYLYSVSHSNKEVSSRSNELGLSVSDINSIYSDYSELFKQIPIFLLSIFGEDVHLESINDHIYAVCSATEKDEKNKTINHTYAADVNEPILYEVLGDQHVPLGDIFAEVARITRIPLHVIFKALVARNPYQNLQPIDEDIRILLEIANDQSNFKDGNPYVKK